MGLPSELPVSAPRQGHEVYPLVSSHPQGWSRHRPAPARAFSEPQRLFGALGEIGQRGMPLQANAFRRAVVEASVTRLCRPLP